MEMLQRLVLASGMLAITVFAVVLPAAADEVSYEKMGRWEVMAITASGMFSYCSADVDNGRVQLRIATNGKNWQVGVPFYGKVGRVEGYFGFGVAGEVARFNVDGDSWASMAITSDQLKAFRTNPSFSIDLDRGEQAWNLKGASAAIDKASECARAKGRKGAVPPAAAANSAYQVIGKGDDGWIVSRTDEGKGVVNCRAERKKGGRFDIVAMRNNGSAYLSVDAERRKGKYAATIIQPINEPETGLRWTTNAEANGERMWFPLEPNAIGFILASVGFRFYLGGTEDTGSARIGKAVGAVWQQVRQCAGGR